MNKTKMINVLGNEMWVAEDRVEEYKAAGHKLAADVSDEVPADLADVEPEEPEVLDPEKDPGEVPEEKTEKGTKSKKTARK